MIDNPFFPCKRLIGIVLLIVLLSGCTLPGSPPNPAAKNQRLVVLYTSDEHGWLAGVEEGRSAANMVGSWQETFGYPQEGPYIVLSGGDNWTGPAISTWFEGQSMVEVMNQMGYDASAMGNHEFDFGLNIFKQRAREAKFSFLGANIHEKTTGKFPEELGIKPYTLVEAGNLRVGIIGLAGTNTPSVTNPVNIASFDFLPYEETLRNVLPDVQAAGAELILVVSHICRADLELLANQTQDLPVAMYGAGHCHESFSEKVGNALLLGGGENMSSYAYADFTVDLSQNTVVDLSYGVKENQGAPPDAAVQDIISRWQDEADAELNVTIGYLEKSIPRYSQELENLITETWLLALPQADIALTNRGGIRDGLASGAVSLADITGVMPFNNTIVSIKLSGRDLLQVLRSSQDELAVGGAEYSGVKWVLKKTGEPLDPGGTYTVLVNDFMYAGGGGFEMLKRMDPAGYYTSIDWRQPVIDWIKAQDSSPDKPLDEKINALGNQR